MTQHFDPFRIIKEVMDDPQVKEAFEMASYDPYAISYTNSILVETNIVNKDIEKVKKQTLNSRYP
ncbi:MAG: hypothetical protein LBG52_01305 [Candidatus Peribacteria bacterium]|jgi:hypothetical protein|nr:hypothetical protein [Candidatus Peribacteria bacterium]